MQHFNIFVAKNYVTSADTDFDYDVFFARTRCHSSDMHVELKDMADSVMSTYS